MYLPLQYGTPQARVFIWRRH